MKMIVWTVLFLQITSYVISQIGNYCLSELERVFSILIIPSTIPISHYERSSHRFPSPGSFVSRGGASTFDDFLCRSSELDSPCCPGPAGRRAGRPGAR